MKTCIKCGSHAFNLYAEGIDQGGFCDVHYWQGRAHRAEALAQPEKGLFIDLIAQHEGLADELAQPDYRAVKTYHEGKPVYVSQPEQEPTLQQQLDKANAEYEKVDAEWDKAASDWDKAYAEVRRIKQLIKEKA